MENCDYCNAELKGPGMTTANYYPKDQYLPMSEGLPICKRHFKHIVDGEEFETGMGTYRLE